MPDGSRSAFYVFAHGLYREVLYQRQSAARRARIARGRPYAAFEAEWLQRKPPEEILTWYGSWPDAKPLQPLMRP